MRNSKRYMWLCAIILLLVFQSVVFGAGYNTKNYMEQGGAKWVIGGELAFTSVNLAGGSFNPFDYTGTLGIMDGSDTFCLYDINLTNANHTGSTNVVEVMNIANITGDAHATERVYYIGTGWDYGLYSGSPLYCSSTLDILGNVTFGADADAATLEIYPATTNKGTLLIQAANNTTADVQTILQNGQAASTATITLPSATSTLPGLSIAGNNTGYLELSGSTSGGIKVAPIATGTAVTTIQNQNVAAATVTLPGVTSTLAILGANTFTAIQELDAGITVDDTNFIVDGTTGAVTTVSSLTALSAAIGGGYASTGASISDAGVGQFAGALTSDGTITSGKAGAAGSVVINGTTNGGITITPIAAGTGQTTLVNQAGTPTITLPDTTCTLPGLGLANAFSANQSITYSKTAAADVGTVRALYGKYALSGSTPVTTAGNNMVGGRGEFNIGDGGVLDFFAGSSFATGVQGKIVASGTTTIGSEVAHQDARIQALHGQLDLTGMTINGGMVSGLNLDMQVRATAINGAGAFDFIHMADADVDKTAQANSFIYAYGEAAFLFDLYDPQANGADWIYGGAHAQATGSTECLKIRLNGTTYYLALYDSTPGS